VDTVFARKQVGGQTEGPLDDSRDEVEKRLDNLYFSVVVVYIELPALYVRRLKQLVCHLKCFI